MTRKIVLIEGFIVASIPYMGFPDSIDTILYTIFGLTIAFFAWSGKKTKVLPEHFEAELRDVEHGEPGHPFVHKESLATSGVSSPEHSDTVTKSESASNKFVEVNFEKKRSRNLKKRITSEEVTPLV